MTQFYNHKFLFLVRQRGIHRKTQTMFVILLDYRQVSFLIAQLLIVRHQMKRSIMNLRIDIVLVQIIIKAQAVGHLNDIKMIGMIGIGSIERSLDAIYSGNASL